jgi:hypothetical protein
MTLEPGIYSGAYVRPERYEREPHTPTVYEYYAADTITGELISELPLVSVSYSRGVSKAGELSGQIPVNQIAGLDIYTSTQPIKTSLFAIKNGQVMWGGIIWSRTYSPVSQQVSITCNTFESYLFKRHIYHTLLYPNTVDQYEVVRQLIDEMQTDFNEFDTSADHVVNVIGAASIGITYETRIAGQHQDTQTWDGGEIRQQSQRLRVEHQVLVRRAESDLHQEAVLPRHPTGADSSRRHLHRRADRARHEHPRVPGQH